MFIFCSEGIIFYNFIVVKFMYHKIHPFEEYI